MSILSFLKTNTKKPAGEKLQLKLSGLHCTSCSLTIDNELEDLPGVISAQTSYAKSLSKVEYDPNQVSPQIIIKTISQLGYTVET